MSSISRILAVAAFEFAQSRRMIRVWLLGLVALLVGVLVTAHRLGIHYYGGGWSGSYAYMTKDLFVQNSILFMALLLAVFGVFYVFDWRHRETDAAFADTLDTSPLTRLEHAWGKFLGTCGGFLVPFLLHFPVLLFGQLFWDMKVPAGVFLTSYFVWAPVALLAPVAVAFGIAGLTGSRALSVIAGLAWVALVWILLGFTGTWAEVPELWGLVASGIVGKVFIWSDFTGYSFEPMDLVMLAGNWLLIAAFVCLGAAGSFAPARSVADNRRRLVITAACFGGWLLLNAWVVSDYGSELRLREAVIAAEDAVAGEPAPTVTRRDLEIELEPGRHRLSGRAVLGLRNDTQAPLERVHLRLNHGLEVEAVEGGKEFERELSVLTVQLDRPLRPGAQAELAVRYAGRIHPASIDASEELFTRRNKSVFTRNLRRFLGRIPAYLEPSIVALGMDAGWYPDPAMLFGREYPQQWRPSFAPSSLAVTLPEGWAAASAGAREAEGRTWRFETRVPVPALSLNAGPFEERSLQVAGKTFRVLHDPRHSRNVEFLAEAAPLIERHVEERLESIRVDAGLDYPLPELTVVEVPQSIAGFSPGWAAPNRLAAPGVVMAREGQLFGARFEFPLKMARSSFEGDSGGVRVSVRVEGEEVASSGGEPSGTGGSADEGADESETPEDGPASAGEEDAKEAVEAEDDELTAFDEARARFDILERFVGTDWTGGDVERAAVKSTWDFRLRGVGVGAPVLSAAFPSFLAELALGRATVETPEAHRIFTSNETFGRLIQATSRGRTEEVAGIVVSALADMDAVYETMQATPLGELDPVAEPGEFLGVLFLKGRQPLMALRERLGRERFNAGVRFLLERHAGGEYRWEQFREAFLAQADAEDRGELEVLFDNWLEGTELPGFVVTNAVAQRLAGERERWQVTATLSNRGSAPGSALFRAGRDDEARSRLVGLAPGEEVEVGLVLPAKPKEWRLDPYLALNRTDPEGDFDVREEPVEAEPFEGVRPAEVLGIAAPVVVDNLDPGFTVTLADGREVSWDARDGEEPLLEQASAFAIFRRPKDWSRWRSTGQFYKPYGLFDITAAIKRATEEGGQPAHWRATLPDAGTYRVEVYLPPAKGPLARRVVPEWDFVIHSPAGEESVRIRTDAAQDGWNDLGRFRFELEGEVELRDVGEEGLVIADAVRFVKEAS